MIERLVAAVGDLRHWRRRPQAPVAAVALGVVGFVMATATVGCDRKVAGGQADGPKIFAAVCANCHGAQGKPSASMVAGMGVRDLTAAEFRARATPALVAAQVKNGSANKLMPAFGEALSPAQIDAVSTWIAAGMPAAP